MGQFNIRTFKDILQRMINRVVARTSLNDITDTSSVKQVLSAASREDDDQYYQMAKLQKILDIDQAIGPDLDDLAAVLNPNIIAREDERTATGEVVFSRQGTTGIVTIAEGTEVTVPTSPASDPLKYVTTAEGTIPNLSQDSAAVPVVAKAGGAKYNVDPNSITGFGSKPSGVDTVANQSAITNGTDEETDDSFRTRIKLYLKSLSRGTVNALESAALTAEDPSTGKKVLFANTVEDVANLGNVIVYIDDGAGTAEDATTPIPGEVLTASALGGEIDFFAQEKPTKTEDPLVVTRTGPAPDGEPTGALTLDTDYTFNPASSHVKLMQASFPNGLPATSSLTIDYTPFTGLIEICQKIIDGDAADRANYPGYRAAGVLVRVLSPTIVQMLFTANIIVKQGFSQTDAATAVEAAISGYINSLGIGEDVILNELRERAMAVPGMYDIAVVTPEENRVILDSQLARILSNNITIA